VNVLHAGALYLAFCIMLSLLAFLGLLLARRADALRTFPLSAALLLFPVTYYITHSAVRYRHPIDPVMTILAVYAVSYAYAKLQGRGVEFARRRISLQAAEGNPVDRASHLGSPADVARELSSPAIRRLMSSPLLSSLVIRTHLLMSANDEGSAVANERRKKGFGGPIARGLRMRRLYLGAALYRFVLVSTGANF
jgi:hypothetical protein